SLIENKSTVMGFKKVMTSVLFVLFSYGLAPAANTMAFSISDGIPYPDKNKPESDRNTVKGSGTETEPFVLTLQTRNDENQIRVETKKIKGPQIAIVVMDMWDRHGCDSITEQINGLIAPMNKTLAAARQLGISVVFSPSDVTRFYEGTPQREKMQGFPEHSI